MLSGSKPEVAYYMCATKQKLASAKGNSQSHVTDIYSTSRSVRQTSTCGTAPRSVGRDNSPGRCTGVMLAAPRGFGCASTRALSAGSRRGRRELDDARACAGVRRTCLGCASAASSSAFRRLRGGIGRLSLLNTTTPFRLEPFAGRPPYACVAEGAHVAASRNANCGTSVRCTARELHHHRRHARESLPRQAGDRPSCWPTCGQSALPHT